MVCKVIFFSKRFGKFGSGVLYFRSFGFCEVSIAKNFVTCKIKSMKGWGLFFGRQVLLNPHTPNKACTRRWGFGGIFKHFPTPQHFPSRTASRRPPQRG
jgi:hypothetical protein